MSRIAFLLLCGLLVLPPTVTAQDTNPAATTESTAPPDPGITLTQLNEQSAITEKLAEQLKQLASQDSVPPALKEKLPAQLEQAQSLKKESTKLLDDSQASAEQLRTSQAQWQFSSEQWRHDQQILKQQAAQLESSLAQLTQEEDLWQKMIQQAETTNWKADARKLQQQATTQLKASRGTLTSALQDTLQQSRQWQELLDTAEEYQLLLHQHEILLRKQLLTSLQEPLWELSTENFRINENTLQELQSRIMLNNHYLTHHKQRGISIAVVALATLLLLWQLRVRRTQLELQHKASMHLRMPLIDRPFSTTVATSVALAMLIYPKPPPLLHSMLSLLLFIPVVRLGLSRLPDAAKPLAWLVSLFFAINNLSVFSEAVPALQRLWIVSCAAISAAVCIYALKKLRSDTESNRQLWHRTRIALWLISVSAGIAAVSGLVGAATLAQFLIMGISNSAYGVLCMVVMIGIMGDLCNAFLYLPGMSNSQLVQRHRHLLITRGRQLATLVCVLAWLKFTLGQFLLDEPLAQWLSAWLHTQHSIGNISLSFSDLFIISLTIWLSFKLSQFIRFIFIEDIAPRARLARGVPDAIATLMHYAILLIGFMLAIGAAGIDLSKLAIMAGALGVGIGIGLQDVVNNFTSGLILLFEQNIKQGDIIQCSTVNGRVINIGLRSSVVRTFDGAEVIVPNSQLVSAQVINWTHSDQQRRITIPVGAAYGSNPTQVIDTLLRVAHADPDILKDPEPTAFFARFGPSSMDFELRAWVASGEVLNDVNSRLCIQIATAFKQEDITIPYPQQDVHVRNWPAQTRQS